MRVLSVGGGSGGHVKPVLAVINELSRLDKQLSVTFVCDKAFEAQSRGLMEHADVTVDVRTIMSGKLRRYHNETWYRRLLDVPTFAKNLKDGVLVGIGFLQSLWLLVRLKPDIVFAKGGFVCLPVGMAARALSIPLVIHDSDSRPGLTNRVLARWAKAIGTGAPLENYPYPEDRSRYVGVPIEAAFHPYTLKQQKVAKSEIGIVDLSKPLLVVTGGGLGSRSINKAVVSIADKLLDAGMAIYHVTGKKHYEAVKKLAPERADYHIVPFVFKDMVSVLGAADVVVSRASATFLQELAALAKPTIIVPAKQLGDQIKNAEVYQNAQAAEVLSDADITDEPTRLVDAVLRITQDKTYAASLAGKLHEFAKPDAALDMATLIVDVAARKK